MKTATKHIKKILIGAAAPVMFAMTEVALAANTKAKVGGVDGLDFNDALGGVGGIVNVMSGPLAYAMMAIGAAMFAYKVVTEGREGISTAITLVIAGAALSKLDVIVKAMGLSAAALI